MYFSASVELTLQLLQLTGQSPKGGGFPKPQKASLDIQIFKITRKPCLYINFSPVA